MVLKSEEINGLKLCVFKWNGVLPKKTNSNSQGFFFLRIYEHMIKQGQNGVITSGFSMVPILIPFDLVYLSCHCYVKILSRLLISYPKMFPPEEIESLAKNIADLILTGFRFRGTTFRGDCDEIWKLTYANEVLDILRLIKSCMNISQKRSTKAIRDDEPKGFYEVKPEWR